MKRFGIAVLGSLVVTLAGLPALAQTEPCGPPTGSVGYDVEPVNPRDQPPGSVGYDIETGQWVYDTDGDTFPDLTEELGGTDPGDPSSNPLKAVNAPLVDKMEKGGKVEKVGFQQGTCRPGFYNWPGAPRLCITLTQNATDYTSAFTTCRVNSSRLCNYEDLGYLFLTSPMDATYDTYGKWLGDFTQNDYVNCGDLSITFDNDPDIWNFEGTCSKWDRRAYWCCHDKT